MRLLARIKIATGVLLTALMIAPWQFLPSARSQLVTSSATASAARISLHHFPVFADFDHDQQLDQAELHASGAHRCIRVRFSNSHESHLEFDSQASTRGTLLAADVNLDLHHDLIWLPHSRLEAAIVWLGDGLGNFKLAPESATYEGELRVRLGDDAGYGITDGSGPDDMVCISSASVSLPSLSKPAGEVEMATLPATSHFNARRDLGLYLSYLRKRGPPTHLAQAIQD